MANVHVWNKVKWPARLHDLENPLICADLFDLGRQFLVTKTYA
jgi:hypothetical protein